MFDSFLIREDSLKNVVKDGKIVGFKFGVRIADYRGAILSLHNGYYVSVDGTEYPREVQKFEINGMPPRSFEELKTCVWEHWDFDDEGMLYIEKEGGLPRVSIILAFSSRFWQPTVICLQMKNGLKILRCPAAVQEREKQMSFVTMIYH